MRILLITSAYNSMTQRVHVELADRGHAVAVVLALGDDQMRAGVRRYDPDLVIAPMLTTAIPADIWSAHPCFIVHPGPRGDRGPSSLDWAIMEGAERWGVTVLQANEEMDAGDIWASAEFTMPRGAKSSVYRTEVCRCRAGWRPAGGRAVREWQLPARAAGLRPPGRGGPADESWRNINAIDDLVEEILTTTDRLTVAAVCGNAAAGGLMLALAADEVWCRSGAVLNPHYRLMGLHGSEYWTYTLPRRVGAQQAARLTEECLPVSSASGLQFGLVDRVIEGGPSDYRAQVAHRAEELAGSPSYAARLAAKARELTAAEKELPLAAYRHQELAVTSRNIFGPVEPYAQLRRAFVYKDRPTRPPPHLADLRILSGSNAGSSQ